MTGVLRAWVDPPRPPGAPPVEAEPRCRRLLVIELWVVFGITLGLSGLRSALSLAQSLLRPGPLSGQRVALNAPAAVNQYIDLGLQLAFAAQLVGWAALGLYLLARSDIPPRAVGLDRARPGSDAMLALGLAALIGVPGLALYLGAHALGLAVTVQPSTLSDTWWRLPVLVVSAAANAGAEEVLLTGYLMTQARRLGAGENRALACSAIIRGSYHLYQGASGGLGNLVMGLVFGRVWQRRGRLWPLIGAHALLDVVAFVGYAQLAGHASWLP